MHDLLHTFLEAFGDGLFLPFSAEPTLHAMYAFGKSLLLPIAVAVGGAAFAAGVSWLAGLSVAVMRARSRFQLSDKHYAAFTRFMRRFGMWLLPLSPFSIGGLLPLLAGFAKVPFAAVLALVAAGRFVYYLGLFTFGWWS